MSTTESHAQLTRGQVAMFAAAVLLMAGAGAAGAYGTYTNTVTEFGRVGTALGVVAAGEGVTLIVALVMVGLTMLGQSAPLAVRTGLWAAPVAAAVIGVAVADNLTEAVVYGLSPMGMSAAAEGIGLLARRIVVHRTGVDMEVQRRNAETVQRLAYHRARAANHPSKGARWRSERASWRLAKRVGLGDAELGVHLVQVQRDRLRQGADSALGEMLVPSAPELPTTAQEAGEHVQPVPTAAAVPEVHPQPLPAVPERPLREAVAADKPRPRTTVRVPDERPAGAPGADWSDEQLADHARQSAPLVPSIRALRKTYGIGQPRAERIKALLKESA
ncbi:hypothetical protein [Streptomyces meridianus]|uniref:Conjugal transfer protein n=1 Tax=Streptomyces meridianus TaxID=2938945 RepID=A0ABT0XD70_9ACTN|nr:hypothetical protein [Streptomyces meridianus]MCM2580467.1 hypothetical protein [Streptomyces meridianus]